MKVPLVSVVVPVFNAEKYVDATIDSALAQTHTELEVIAVDDGSSDASVDIVQSKASRDSRVLCLTRQNGGPAAARNTGIQQAKGEYIAFLDADDLWLPDKLQKQMELIYENPAMGLVHTGGINFDETQSYPYREKALPRIMPRSEAFELLFTGNFISTSTVLARREWFQRLGLFDESMDYFAVEDYDMWLRFACEGDLGFINEPLIRYRLHNAGISKHTDRSYTNEGNVIRKWYANDNACVKSLKITPAQRQIRLTCNWGNELIWTGRARSASKRFASHLFTYGFAWPILIGVFKSIAVGLKQLITGREAVR